MGFTIVIPLLGLYAVGDRPYAATALVALTGVLAWAMFFRPGALELVALLQHLVRPRDAVDDLLVDAGADGRGVGRGAPGLVAEERALGAALLQDAAEQLELMCHHGRSPRMSFAATAAIWDGGSTAAQAPVSTADPGMPQTTLDAMS